MTNRKLAESSKDVLIAAAMRAGQVWLALMCLMVLSGQCLPLDPRQAAKDREKEMEDRLKERMQKFPEFPGADREEYKRYWEEAVKSNPNLQERLERIRNFRPEDLAELHPHLGERMARNSDEVRSRLEEARRMTVEDMRNLQKLQMLRDIKRNGPDTEWLERREAMREHLPPHFTDNDLQGRLNEQRRVLEELDKRRREDFKRYEMQMEHKRRMKLKDMDEQKRLNAEEEFRKQREKLMHHDRVEHPASKQQLEDVWKKDDDMKEEEFDPKTFFMMHDTNGDKQLDQMELEALFFREVKKVYGDDMRGIEAHEEMARMREHVLSEIDKNKDALVSLQEFMQFTGDKDFENNEEWKPIVDEPDQLFDDKDFEQYEEDYDDYYDYTYDEHGNIIGAKAKPSEQQPGEHQQGGQQPATHQQGEQQPAGHQPGEQQMAGHQPGEQQTAGHQLGEQQPAGHQLGEQQPAGHQLGEQQPAGHQQGEQQPAGHQQGEQQPAGHQPGEQQPGHQGEQQPGQQHPNVEQKTEGGPPPQHEEQKMMGDKGVDLEHAQLNLDAIKQNEHAQLLFKVAQEEHAPDGQGNQKQQPVQ